MVSSTRRRPYIELWTRDLRSSHSLPELILSESARLSTRSIDSAATMDSDIKLLSGSTIDE